MKDENVTDTKNKMYSITNDFIYKLLRNSDTHTVPSLNKTPSYAVWAPSGRIANFFNKITFLANFDNFVSTNKDNIGKYR